MKAFLLSILRILFVLFLIFTVPSLALIIFYAYISIEDKVELIEVLWTFIWWFIVIIFLFYKLYKFISKKGDNSKTSNISKIKTK